MKKIFFLTLLAGLMSSIMFAQTIQLIMSPNPSPYFSDWQNKTETARLIVNNTSQTSIDCKIKTQLFNGDDELVAETDFAKMPEHTLMAGISQFNAEDIYPLEAVKTYGNSFNSMSSTGRIPDGNYRICTDLVDPVKGTSLSTQSPQCKMFRIIAYQAPVLIVPREDQIIPQKETKGIVFRWTPVAPSPNYIVTYRLQVWEVLEGQTNVDALRNNWPIIEKDLRGILQTQWPVDFAPPEEGMHYVWTITPLDSEERNLVDGYGFADPFGFSIMTESSADPAILISVKLQQPPPNQLRLSDLSNFTLTNPTDKPIEVSLACKMTSQKPKPIVIIVVIILKQFTLPPGTTKITDDAFETGDIQFSTDEWRDAFNTTGNVPSGDYSLCVSVLDTLGTEIGKGCMEQKIEHSACDDFTVDFMVDRKIYTGDSGGVEEINITNRYKLAEAGKGPASFSINTMNDVLIAKADDAPKGWARTPSKFPPGSTSIKWTNNSGDIPQGETKFGSLLFTNVKSGSISLQYEWLGKDGKVICKDSAIRYDVGNAGTTQKLTLISPKNGESINGDNPIFSWLNSKVTNDREKYRLKIVELTADESPEEAMQHSESFFDVFFEMSIKEEVMYQYPESAPKLVEGRRYAWMVIYGDLQSKVGIFDRWGINTNRPRCLCGNWLPIEINKKNYDCGSRIAWKCNEPIVFSGTYQCNPNTEKCKAETSWEMIRNGQPVQSGSGLAVSYTPTANGFYILSLHANCNGVECEPCMYTFVVDDCAECDCGKWGNNQIQASINDLRQKPISCGQELSVDLNAHLSLTFPSFFCQPDSCKATYSWDLSEATNSVHLTGSSNPFHHNFNVPGNYTLSFNAYCAGEQICDSCVVFIHVAGEDCGCSDKWNPLIINKRIVDCGGKMAWKCNEAINFSSTYGCKPDNERCKAETSWEMSKDGSVIQSASGGAGSFTPASNGIYTLSLIASCNGIKCAPCMYTFVVENCSECDCNEKKWDVKQGVTYHTDDGGNSQSIECSGRLKNKIIAGSVSEYTATPYNCRRDKCTTEYTWEIINVSSGAVHSSGTALSFPIEFTAPSSTGDYQLVVSPVCGGTNCGSCGFYFSTSPCSQSALPAPTVNPGTGIQETQFTANWTAVAGATGYFLDVSTNPAFNGFVGAYHNLSVGAVNTTIISGLNCNSSYFYRIRAINECGVSANSNFMRVQTLLSSLSVTALAASGNHHANQFTANWNAVLAANYYIDVSTSPDFSTYISGYWNLSVGNVTSVIVSGLICNTTYYYRIRALSACGGQSENSNTISVRTILPLQAPPTAMAATQLSLGQFKANWTAVSGATAYFFDLSTDPGFTSFEYGINNADVGTSTQYILMGLQWCNTYYYRLRAVNECGSISINSNTVVINSSPPDPHGSWVQGPGDYSFKIGAFGTSAEINGCPGLTIPITIEVWGAGGGGGSGGRSIDGFDGSGGNGGGGGGGGGYASMTMNVVVPVTAGALKILYIHVGSGGIAGALDYNSGGTGGESNVKEQYNVYYAISANGGHGGQLAGNTYSLGGSGGSGSINNWSGSSGTNGGIVSDGCNGGAGGLGGAGGGPGRTGPTYFNEGGNGGHGGYLHHLINPTCTEHGQDFLLSPGAAGGNGRVKISW